MTLTTDLPGMVALREALADVLLNHWERVAADLARRLRLQKADDDTDSLDDAVDAAITADTPSLANDLQQTVVPPLASAYTGGAGQAEASIGLTWGLRNARALDYARDRAAELVGMRRLGGRLVPNPDARWAVTDRTRDDLKHLVTQLMADGSRLSYRDLKTQIEALPSFHGLFGEARAETIARTELGLAQNAGQAATYEQAGIQHVQILDGLGCGWLSHTDPDKADGSIRTLADYQAHPLSHPNCRRSGNAILPSYPGVKKDGEAGGEASGGGITVAGTGLVGYNLEGQKPRCRRCAAADIPCEHATDEEHA